MHKSPLLVLLLLITLSGCYNKTESPQFCDVRQENAKEDSDYLYLRTILPDRPLTLLDIIEIANQLNLDLLVKKLDWTIQEEIASGETLKMLPSFIYSSWNSHRNNSTASSQLTSTTGALSPPLISSTQTDHHWDYTLTWNLLDFGLAYFRSRSEIDRAQVARFQYEKVKQNLVLDIYKSYWKAVSAKISSEHSKEVIALSQNVKITTQREAKERLISSIQGFQTEDQMLQIQKRLIYLEDAYFEAKAELAGLMGIPQTYCFELAPFELSEMPDEFDLCEMEDIALLNRPELYGADFQGSITANQARVELLQMFPSFSLFEGFHTDKNPFLLHSTWILVGCQMAWNLFSLPQHLVDTLAARDRQYQAYISRLALTVGVISQVNIAYWKYQEAFHQYNLQREITSVQRRLADATKKQFLYGLIGIVDVVKTEGDAVESETALFGLYGDLQVALEQINNAMGRPLLYNTIENDALESDEIECDEIECDEIEYNEYE